MTSVKLTRRQLAVLEAMIERLKDEGLPKNRKVSLRALAFDTTVMERAITVVEKITGSKPPSDFVEDAKTLARIEQLAAKLTAKTSLEDLLKLRRSATARKA